MKEINKYIIIPLMTIFLILQGVEWKYCRAQTLRIPDTTIAYSNTIDIPIFADASLDNYNIFSVQLRLYYNSYLIQPQSAPILTTGTLFKSTDIVLINSTEANYLSIAGVRSTKLKGKGILMYIRFNIKQSGYTQIRFSDDGQGVNKNNFYNEGSIWNQLQDGSINIQPKPVITIYPDNGILIKGEKLQFNVNGGTAPYTWKVTDNTVASIDNTGLLTALKVGKCRVIALDNDNFGDTTDIIEVRPFRLSIPTDLQEYAGKYIEAPVNTTDLTGLGILSGSFNVNYNNTDILKPIGVVQTGTLLSTGYTVNLNTGTSGVINLDFYGTLPLTGSGTLLKIKFLVQKPGASNLNISNVLFNENILAATTDGLFQSMQPPYIYITPNPADIFDGQTKLLTVNNATPPLTWTLSDTGYVTISGDGQMTAIKGGVITATVKDSLGSETTATINIYDSYIKIPDTTAPTGTVFDYPIYWKSYTALSSKQSYSFQLTLIYDTTYLSFISINQNATLTQSWTYADNPVNGSIKAAFFGTSPINAAGILTMFRFQLKPAMIAGTTTYLYLSNVLSNEGDPIVKFDNSGSIRAIQFSISGNVTYDNTANSPLSKVSVILTNTDNNHKDTCITDANGYYVFPSVPMGNYRLNAISKSPVKSVNTTDALLTNRYYIKAYNITSALRKKAADVNLDSKVNTTDALLINRRYIGAIKNFKAGDWLFESFTLTVQNSDILQNIKGICVGDVNGSYLP